MASIFQRKKGGTWWIKYYVNGRQVYYSLGTKDARVAKQVKRQIEGEEAKGELLAPSKTPLPAFLEDFCKFLSTKRTRKSYSSDLSILRIFFGPICPSLVPGGCVNKRWVTRDARPVKDRMERHHVKAGYLEEITGSLIEGFISRRLREDGIAAKTANRYREVLHRMFGYAAKYWGFVPPDRRNPNPAAMVERRAEPAHNIRFLSIAQIDEQLRVFRDSPTLNALVATFIYAGLRREEALWLTVDDVDLDKRLIYVRAKLIDGEHWQPKTKRNRVVPISSSLHKILAAYSPERAEPWFFHSPRSRRWDPDNFSQDLREINRSQGLNWSCLDFRHTFGSLLAQKGESLYKIAELMGNSPEICRRHYAALMPEKMHDVVEFSSDTSPAADKTEVLLKQILEKLDAKEPAAVGPKLQLIRTVAEGVAS
jgi:integrase/recombinase XerD